MLEGMKQIWNDLRTAKPGERFQRAYHSHQARHSSAATRVISIIVGLAVVALGVVALPAPGPGTLIIALGGAFIARESLVVARVMDWLELRLRDLLRWVSGAWKNANAVQRVFTVALVVCVAGGAVYVAYRVFIRG